MDLGPRFVVHIVVLHFRLRLQFLLFLDLFVVAAALGEVSRVRFVFVKFSILRCLFKIVNERATDC